jgi:hypothetical protein
VDREARMVPWSGRLHAQSHRARTTRALARLPRAPLCSPDVHPPALATPLPCAESWFFSGSVQGAVPHPWKWNGPFGALRWSVIAGRLASQRLVPKGGAVSPVRSEHPVRSGGVWSLGTRVCRR